MNHLPLRSSFNNGPRAQSFRSPVLPFVALAFVSAGVIAAGCATGVEDSIGGSGGATSSTTTQMGTTTSTTTGDTSSSGFMTAGSGGMTPGPAVVYGHSPDTLFELDPITKAVTTIGKFTGCEVVDGEFPATGIQDMALDKDSNIFVTSKKGLFTVDPVDASCTKVATGDYPNSLSFVPAGTVDPNEEALVGYVVEPNPVNKNQYVRINTTTGAITKIGGVWTESVVSSGDIVSVKGGPTYLTLKGGSNNECTDSDCVAEVNPQSGKLIKILGTLDSYPGEKVFGFAFWGGSSYGFTNAGKLFELKIMGNALITTPITTPSGLVFWGAGSSTAAPVVPQ